MILPTVSSNSILPFLAVYCERISAPPNKPSFARIKLTSQVSVRLPFSSLILTNSTGLLLPEGFAEILVTCSAIIGSNFKSILYLFPEFDPDM